MRIDFSTAADGALREPSAVLDKSHSAARTEFRTHPIVMTLPNAVFAEIRWRLTDLGYVAVGDQSEEFAAHMNNDIENLTLSFRALGVSID